MIEEICDRMSCLASKIIISDSFSPRFARVAWIVPSEARIASTCPYWRRIPCTSASKRARIIPDSDGPRWVADDAGRANRSSWAPGRASRRSPHDRVPRPSRADPNPDHSLRILGIWYNSKNYEYIYYESRLKFF